MDETLRSFSPRFEPRSIRIEVNGGDLKLVTIMADADRLKQLFSNILENALRYVHTPGVLKIFSELQAGYLVLSFEDSGPGVPEASFKQGYDFEGYERTIDSHIKNLRKKIAGCLPGKGVISTIYGVGYKLSAPPGK